MRLIPGGQALQPAMCAEAREREVQPSRFRRTKFQNNRGLTGLQRRRGKESIEKVLDSSLIARRGRFSKPPGAKEALKIRNHCRNEITTEVGQVGNFVGSPIATVQSNSRVPAKT